MLVRWYFRALFITLSLSIWHTTYCIDWIAEAEEKTSKATSKAPKKRLFRKRLTGSAQVSSISAMHLPNDTRYSLDGNGYSLNFINTDQELIVIGKNSQLNLKNIALNNFSYDQFVFETGSSVHYRDGTSLNFNRDISLVDKAIPWYFEGDVIINANHHELMLGGKDFKIKVHKQLTIKNTVLRCSQGLEGLSMISDASIRLHNSTLDLGAYDLTILQGSLEIKGLVRVLGDINTSLALKAPSKLTILPNSTLVMGQDLVLKYQASDAATAENNLILTDSSSNLVFDGGGLTLEDTGLIFDTGNMEIRDEAKFKIPATKSLDVGQQADIVLLLGSKMVVTGPINYGG